MTCAAFTSIMTPAKLRMPHNFTTWSWNGGAQHESNVSHCVSHLGLSIPLIIAFEMFGHGIALVMGWCSVAPSRSGFKRMPAIPLALSTGAEDFGNHVLTMFQARPGTTAAAESLCSYATVKP